ncbi:hypothetical protein HB779_11015 [Phyllobacterium sp. 628]|uniref:DUF6456 domain-containing protein n=1 Tax=Phyllobacterium sp. 628 TaxID=2718938 RepID=UPI0016628055|nr:DUF6456 domain-containing protein [Phyllobacterium sp. 628]QND52376.1 hypothetical protein HB779_11015 [Phyllobacterium sp. 628]
MSNFRKDSGPVRRVLRFLAKAPAEGAASEGARLTLESTAGGAISMERTVVDKVLRQGLAMISKDRLSISDAGRAWLRRLDSTDDAYAAQHRSEATIILSDINGSTQARCNDAESPLGLLRKRKDASGQPMISDAAFRAGERLRGDYTLGNLMPALGVNWDVTGSGSRHCGSNGVLEITDAALAARQRVERALEAVGPELSGVLVDVCCFLKGLETVERERLWPVRSAKLILKTALAALDRHYYPPSPSRRRMQIIHWGTEDYRPVIAR